MRTFFLDSPQVAQVYVHNTRIPHPHYPEVTNRFYETVRQLPSEPPPAHRSAALHSVVAPQPGSVGGGAVYASQLASPTNLSHLHTKILERDPTNLSHVHPKILEREREREQREREIREQQQQQLQREQQMREKERISIPGNCCKHFLNNSPATEF